MVKYFSKKQKLNDEHIERIRELGATKQYSYNEIAQKMYHEDNISISVTTVAKILKTGAKR